MIKTILFIAIGGAIGSVLRYLLSVFVQKFWLNQFPLATFFTNIIGCFLIGLFIGLLEKNNITDSPYKWLLITGFCGGFTTFSAFAVENFNFIQGQNILLSVIYIGISIFCGILAVWLGLSICK